MRLIKETFETDNDLIIFSTKPAASVIDKKQPAQY